MRPYRYLLIAFAALCLGLVLRATTPIHVDTGSWASAGQMSTVRTGAASVLLPDGRVMIIGGADANGNTLATAEFFNTNGTFSPAPSMSTPRTGHAAIWLLNGEVLVTGGTTTGGGAVNSAESFDPLTGAWRTLPANLAEARTGHTLAQLADGSVLVVGGENAGTPITALETYSLFDETFSFSASMPTARKDAAAAALPDGRVLIAGGSSVASDGTAAPLASTVIYDPATASVTYGPAMSSARVRATATSTYDGLAIIGGNDGTNDLGTADIYSAWSNTFRTVSGATPRSGHVALLLPNNGGILVTGGTGGASADVLQPWRNNKAGQFLTANPSPTNHDGGFVVPSVRGLMLAAGGKADAATSADLYGFATIATDKSDYAPGTTVVMTGAGFQPGETVVLNLQEWVNQTSIAYPDYTVTADASGAFTYSEYAPTPSDLNSRYHLTAIGQNSGYQAQTVFKDGPQGDTTSISVSCDSSSVPNNTTVNCRAQVNNTQAGAPNGWPQGSVAFILVGPNQTAQGTFSPSSCPLAQIGTTTNSSCTVSFTANTVGIAHIKGNYAPGGQQTWQNASDSSYAITVTSSTTINVVNLLSPTNDAGRFNLLIDGTAYASNVGNGGTTGGQVVPPSVAHTVSETAGTGSNLSNYSTSIVCKNGSTNVASSNTTTVNVTPIANAAIICTITNTRLTDTTAPTTTATPSGSAGTNGWYTSDVLVSLSATDNAGGSGVKEIRYSLDGGAEVATTTNPASVSITTEGSHSLTYYAVDNANNTETAHSLAIKIDKTAPSDVSLSVTSGTLGAHSWYMTDVTVHTSGSDSVSGVTCTADQNITTETAGITLNGSCTNGAGLKTDAAPLSIKLDKTGPSANLSVTAGATGANGWYTSDVTVTTSGTDTISNPVTCSADQFQTSETAGAVFNGSCTNDAGLKTDASPLAIKLDKTAPTNVSLKASGTQGKNGWYTSDVTVTTSGEDAISGVSCTSDQVINTETPSAQVSGACTNGAGLKTDASPINIKLDKTGPSADLKVTAGTPGTNGWYTSDVTATATGGDDISGPVTCTDPQSVTSETTGKVLNATCENQAGLTTNATPLTVKLDKTPPTATLTVVDGTLGKNDWYVSDVKLHATGTDDISSPVVCDADVTVSTETSGTSYKLKCTNDAGLPAQTNEIILKLDKTAPTVTASTSPTANSYGWNNTDVTVKFVGNDSVSGIEHCEDPVVLSSEASGQSATRKCYDNAGNIGSGTATNINIDKTAPAIQRDTSKDNCSLPGNDGWCRGTQTAGFSASDALAGLDQLALASFTQSTTENGGTIQIASGKVCDKAGNCNSGINAGQFQIDSVAPSITAKRSAPPNLNGWNNVDVTISFTCTDDTSGVDAGAVTSPKTLGEGANQSAAGTCSDKAGNTANLTESNINIDKTAPTITASRTTPANSYGWNNTDVVAGYTASDSLSGLVDPATASGTYTFASEGAGQSHTFVVTDKAGNSASATIDQVDIDKTAPTLTPIVNPNPPILNGAATATSGAADALSGIATQSCTQPDTSSVGTKTLTCTAMDKAGNSVGPQSVSYSVQYLSAGVCLGDLGHQVLQPINVVAPFSNFKNGSTVPVKFRVCDANGKSIGTAGLVSGFGVYGTLPGTQAFDEYLTTSTAADTAFRWDPTAQQWIYNLSTKGGYNNGQRFVTGQTYYFAISLNDGTNIPFNFSMK